MRFWSKTPSRTVRSAPKASARFQFVLSRRPSLTASPALAAVGCVSFPPLLNACFLPCWENPMRPEDYPAQEPFSTPARTYHEAVMARAPVIEGEEISYGA